MIVWTLDVDQYTIWWRLLHFILEKVLYPIRTTQSYYFIFIAYDRWCIPNGLNTEYKYGASYTCHLEL